MGDASKLDSFSRKEFMNLFPDSLDCWLGVTEGVSQELGRICRDIPSGTLLEWECCIAKHFLAIIDILYVYNPTTFYITG